MIVFFRRFGMYLITNIITQNHLLQKSWASSGFNNFLIKASVFSHNQFLFSIRIAVNQSSCYNIGKYSWLYIRSNIMQRKNYLVFCNYRKNNICGLTHKDCLNPPELQSCPSLKKPLPLPSAQKSSVSIQKNSPNNLVKEISCFVILLFINSHSNA